MSDHFFIVGAQRCGTTYLYEMLDAHPEIEMAKPARPEPKFFSDDSLRQRGVSFYESQFFDSASQARVRGEKSTSYIESPLVARRIAESYPHAKILMVFRDPIQRAISNYWFSVNHGVETLSMDEAFRREEERREDYDRERFSVSPFAYLQRGRYADYLKLWKEHFPSDHVLVLIFERMIGEIASIQSVYRFLGVAPDFEPPRSSERVNPSEPGAESLTPRTEKFLRDYFRRPIAELSQLLGDPLPEWGRF